MRTDVRLALLTAGSAVAVALGVAACRAGQDDGARPPAVRETMDLPLQDGAARVRTLTQAERRRLQQQIVIQPSARHEDVFRQQEAIPPSIDILIVVDNSASMAEEQLNLSDKLADLLSDLSEVDWQINVITTDNSCRRLPELPLTPASDSITDVFTRAVRAGTTGSGFEMALSTTVRHLQGRCTQDPPWLRQGTDLALLIVSDEDEDSGSAYRGRAQRFAQDVAALGYEAGGNLKVYGIIGHPTRPCPTALELAATYAEAVALSEGLWGSICDADYSATLSAISRDIRLNRKIEFPLRFAPVLTTVRLELDGRAYDGAWAVVGQRLVLADPLPGQTTLVVSYEVESARFLNLGVSPDEYVLEELTLDGKPLAPARYHYDPARNTVRLGFDPAAGAVIGTTLVQRAPLATRFPFPAPGDGGVRCYLGGAVIAASYDAERGELLVVPPIPAGGTAHCLY